MSSGKTSLLLLLVSTMLHAGITRSEALKIGSVEALGASTQYRSEDHIAKALKNSHWQRANTLLLYEHTTLKAKRGSIASIDYDTIISELHLAAKQDVLVAAYQGYVLVTMLTQKRGAYAKRDLFRFTSIMMRYDLCQGYYDSAYAYANGWVNGSKDYDKALSLLEKGRSACMMPQITPWQRRMWEEHRAKYSALKRLRESR